MVILATVVAGALVVAQTDWGQERARQLIVSRTAPLINGEFSMKSFRWTLDGHAELKDVVLTQEGRPLFRAVRASSSILLNSACASAISSACESRRSRSAFSFSAW